MQEQLQQPTFKQTLDPPLIAFLPLFGDLPQLLIVIKAVQDIGERYPQWLATHAGSLSNEDLARYTEQHQHILAMCRLYEEDADNFSAIFSQLQKARDCYSSAASSTNCWTLALRVAC